MKKDQKCWHLVTLSANKVAHERVEKYCDKECIDIVTLFTHMMQVYFSYEKEIDELSERTGFSRKKLILRAIESYTDLKKEQEMGKKITLISKNNDDWEDFDLK